MSTKSDPFSFESKSLLNPIEIVIQEEFNWNNPIYLLPEVPTPVLPSNLDSGPEPLGYMWSDGVMTLTEERSSKIIKRLTPNDEWIPTDTPSVFNEQLAKGEISNAPEKSDVYIIDRAKIDLNL